MARFLKKRHQTKGMPPGSLIFVGQQKVDNIHTRVIDFDREHLFEDELEDIHSGAEFAKTNSVSWINSDGVHDGDFIREIGETFALHPLLLEDIMNTGQRPKIEEFDNCLFIVLKMLRYEKESGTIAAEQLSMVLGQTWLLTFQEEPGDVFDPVRERIRKGRGRIRAAGIDYLAYTLMDTIVDNYIYIIEMMGEKIEDLESEILSEPNLSALEKINSLKQEMNYLRKLIRPAKDAVIQFAKLENPLIRDMTLPFIKDLQDLIMHAAEAIDIYREILSDHFNTYNSLVSNRMNDIMKVLTIIATIFIPITFIAGIYGMNFEYMPELKWRFAYFGVWGVIIIVIGLMVYFFKRKRWF